MKKNFKFMLVALLAFVGILSAWAALAEDDVITVGHFDYLITKMPGTSTNGTATLIGIAEGVADEDLLTDEGNDKVLEFPGEISWAEGSKTYKFDVTKMAAEVYADRAYYATKVIIPKQLTEIPSAAFNTLTNLKSIEFAEGSKVTKIGAQAFASTKITSFDFSPCEYLEGLNDEVFVERSNVTPNPNKNSYIVNVTLPTTPLFKHINGAFRNLTSLETITNLDQSWITEIVADAFSGTAIKTLVLPDKDLQYVDQKALEGSVVEDLTIKVGKLLYLGGCDITYLMSDAGEYYYTYDILENPATKNLYGLNLQSTKKAPLKVLNLQGKLMGKICTMAFADCDNLDGLDLTGLTYGSKAQFETAAFRSCGKITELEINDIADNETSGYTFEASAFGECPVATLTMHNITTAKAVNSEAFGTSLKDVTIKGNVFANGPVFASRAFVFGKEANATLNLAYSEDGVAYLSSNDAITTLIPGNAFDFMAVYNATSPSAVKVTVGEIKSKGAVFGEGAIVGPVKELTFAGNIAQNGLTVGGNDVTPVGVKILKDGISQATEASTSYEFTSYPTETSDDEYATGVVKKITEKNGYTIVEVKENSIASWEGNKYAVEGTTLTDGRYQLYNVTENDGEYEIAQEPIEVWIEIDDVEEVEAAEAPNVQLTKLTFKGTIGTNGIGGVVAGEQEVKGEGTFSSFTALTSVKFEGLMSSLAVASGAFDGSGKVVKGIIGTEEAPFVDYTVTNIADYTVNPFAPDAFAAMGADRIIWWNVANEDLAKRILAAIQKAELGDDYEGEEFSTKFDVYKWVAKLPADEEPDALHFLVFQDLSKNGNPKIAWGRYDLGAFKQENNKYYKEESDKAEEQAYEQTDMIIPRYQETTGVKVKLTLYGLYTDEDDFEQVSSTYLVPLRVINGTYQIQKRNKHMIIVKAEIQGAGEFADKDVKIYYNNAEDEAGNPGWVEGEGSAAISQFFTTGNTAVWSQLQTETENGRVYTKADISWTHQELWDAVTHYNGETAANIATADLWIMTNPHNYKGFRIDRNEVKKDDNTFIGLGWYYTFLKNYKKAGAARVIWLDEAQATAIFGVKNVNAGANGVKSGAIYNLQGVRVSNPTKGLYIQDGKKFVVK